MDTFGGGGAMGHHCMKLHKTWPARPVLASASKRLQVAVRKTL